MQRPRLILISFFKPFNQQPTEMEHELLNERMMTRVWKAVNIRLGYPCKCTPTVIVWAGAERFITRQTHTHSIHTRRAHATCSILVHLPFWLALAMCWQKKIGYIWRILLSYNEYYPHGRMVINNVARYVLCWAVNATIRLVGAQITHNAAW